MRIAVTHEIDVDRATWAHEYGIAGPANTDADITRHLPAMLTSRVEEHAERMGTFAVHSTTVTVVQPEQGAELQAARARVLAFVDAHERGTSGDRSEIARFYDLAGQHWLSVADLRALLS